MKHKLLFSTPTACQVNRFFIGMLCIALFLLFPFVSAFAQMCATSGVTQSVTKKTKTPSLASRINGEQAIVVNLYFNIMNTSSSSTVTRAQCEDALEILNGHFKDSDIAFVFRGYRNYYNSSLAVINGEAEFEQLEVTNTLASSLHVYLVDDIIANGISGIIGRAALPGTYLALQKDYRDTFVLAHEIGHNFDLFHTFRGSSCETGLNIVAELPDGSNCATAGDLICDTPADPCMNQSTVSSTCVFTGNPAYSPDTRNYMSYTELNCGDRFSAGQIERMREALVLAEELEAIQVSPNVLARPIKNERVRNNYTKTPVGGGCFEIQYFEERTLTFQSGYAYTIVKTVQSFPGPTSTTYTFTPTQTPRFSEGFSDFTYTATITDMTGVSHSGSGSAGWTTYIDCPIWFPLMSNQTEPIQSGTSANIPQGLYSVPIHDEEKKEVIEKAKIQIIN